MRGELSPPRPTPSNSVGGEVAQSPIGSFEVTASRPLQNARPRKSQTAAWPLTIPPRCPRLTTFGDVYVRRLFQLSSNDDFGRMSPYAYFSGKGTYANSNPSRPRRTHPGPPYQARSRPAITRREGRRQPAVDRRGRERQTESRD